MTFTTSPAGERICDSCGVPMDASCFDVVGGANLATHPLRPGEQRVLARFVLPARYCGVLKGFAQLTDRLETHGEHATPGVRWIIRCGGRPLAPYHDIRLVVNPWGEHGFETSVRLDEQSAVELVIQGVDPEPATGGTPPPGITRVWGRIHGRYWYNSSYGDQEVPCS